MTVLIDIKNKFKEGNSTSTVNTRQQMTDKPNILYVDDEVNNLTGFKAAFRRDYKITTTESAEKAIELLREKDFEVIISDQRMPGMTGVEFFEAIKDDHPEPVRMLLTGYADIESVIKAINEGNVYRYISKPWQEHELKMTIDNAVEFYQTKNQLRQRNFELEKAYDELEKFVYSASHDMRAPLASVLGIVQLAKMENSNSEFDDYLDKIESSIKKLDVFIQNIISYFRSEKKEIEKKEINLDEVINDILESLAYFESAPDTEIKMNIQQENTYYGDETRMKLIINNLISNAIRFQDPDKTDKHIDINVKVNADEAEMKISDNGIGISNTDVHRIFEMFYSTVSENSGSGIGLYIVSETIKKLSGSIDVDSIPGEGTTFTVKIPQQK